MATSGDRYLATSGDFFMATDTSSAAKKAEALFKIGGFRRWAQRVL